MREGVLRPRLKITLRAHPYFLAIFKDLTEWNLEPLVLDPF